MGNFITTNIRLDESDYLRLKEEALKQRKSLSAIIRDKLSANKPKQESPGAIINKITKHVNKNVKHLKNIDAVEIIRQIRDEANGNR